MKLTTLRPSSVEESKLFSLVLEFFKTVESALLAVPTPLRSSRRRPNAMTNSNRIRRVEDKPHLHHRCRRLSKLLPWERELLELRWLLVLGIYICCNNNSWWKCHKPSLINWIRDQLTDSILQDILIHNWTRSRMMEKRSVVIVTVNIHGSKRVLCTK